MTSETMPYAVAGFLSGSLFMTLIFCLILRAVEPKRDVTAEIMDGLREPTWKTTTTTRKPVASHE
jgi:hypothetical protein